jgi:hypothetical protein
MPVNGFLGEVSAFSPWTAAFVAHLRELGWIEGRNLAIAARDASSAFPRSQASSLQDARTLVAVARAPRRCDYGLPTSRNLENVG